MDLSALYQKCGIDRLPLDPGQLARILGCGLVTYEKFCRDTGTDLLTLLRSHNPDAFTHMLLDGPVVVYNRQKPPGRRRWNVVHELSHVLLGELSEGAAEARDLAADRLTADLLAPLPVVSMCGVRTARELQQLCGLSLEAAGLRWKELCAFRRGENGEWNDSDWTLVRHFQPFISAVLDGFSPQSTTVPVY